MADLESKLKPLAEFLLAPGETLLKPASGRVGAFIGLTFFALFWNGIVGVFVVLVDEHVKTASASRHFIISASLTLTAAAAAPHLVDAGPGRVQIETAGEGIDKGRRRAAGSGGPRQR